MHYRNNLIKTLDKKKKKTYNINEKRGNKWKKQKNISGKVIFSRWFFLIHLRQRQKEVFLILTGYCGHRIRHLICSTSQVTISKWQELRRKRLRSLKMERSAPSRWQEQDPVERRRRKIRGWNENCWQMKKNWQNITCL